MAACGGGGGAPKISADAMSTPPVGLPTAALTASATSIASGGESTLTWSSTDATACTATGGWTGALAASGSQSSGPLTATTTFSLTCAGAGGTSTAVTETVTVDALPTVTLTAAPASVANGAASTLTWASQNATACTASQGWSGALATNGTQSTGALLATTPYALTCTGPGGTSTAATATVTVAATASPPPATPPPVTAPATKPAPTVTLTAAPITLATGMTSALTWASQNATACTASGGWTGALAASGTQTTAALTATTSYSLTCMGPGGTSAAATATVTVTPPVIAAAVPTVSLTATPTTVAYGGRSTLTWASINATACTATGGWTGAQNSSGSQVTMPLTAPTTYSLTCTGAGGTSTPATVQVTVTPTATLVATPSVVASGGVSSLAWTSTNATACTASGAWAGALAANGNKATAALTASQTYSLACTAPGLTSAVVSATVTVSNQALTLAPSRAAITLTRTQQFTATVPGGGMATWMVDGVAGGNAAVGTLSATGLYTAGTATGVHTVVATSAANTAETGIATVAVTDLAGVYTYHNNIARDGTNPQEYALTKANVNTASFGKLGTCAVDGAVYAQPLWVANVTVNGAKHNVVLVATEHDGLFAFDGDAAPCAKLWSANLIDAAHGGTPGETAVPYALLGAGLGDIQPEVGITGTPVVDPATGILYAVTKSVNAAQTVFYQRVHAIDITTGNEKAGAPLLAAGTYPGTGDGNGTGVVAFNTRQELQRTGLALVNGVVYVAWTAHEDKSPWYGWMMSYAYTGNALVQKAVLNVAPHEQKSGIWMSGGAPAADAENNLFVITGNGTYNAATNDYGDSLLKVTPALTVAQSFTPSDEVNDGNQDDDFGSGGAAILADLPAGNNVVHALICGGKDHEVYVLNRDMLGGLGDAASVQHFDFGSSVFATGALWNNTFYLGGFNGKLQAYTLNTANAQFTLSSTSTHTYGFAGATPSVSSSGATQNGIVWTVETGAYCTHHSGACGPAVLFANDAANVATSLWNSSLIAADAAGYAVKFTLPTVANGRVYVGTRGNNTGGVDTSTSTPGELDIYGLKP